MASEGVLNPRPTSLYQRFSFVATFFPTDYKTSEKALLGVVYRLQRFQVPITHHGS